MSSGRYANKKSILQPKVVHVYTVTYRTMVNLQGHVCVVLLLAVGTLVGGDEDIKVGSSGVKIAARSGVMEFYHDHASGLDMVHRRRVHIEMARVVQIDKDGNEVMDCLMAAKEEREKHPITAYIKGKLFSNFGQANFTIEAKKVWEYMKNAGKMRASSVRFHANLGSDVGKMAIDVAMPEEDGEVDIGGERQTLKRGDMKFDIEMTDWSWCKDEGEQGAAAFLDVYVNVEGSHVPTLTNRRSASAPASFDLGDNTTIGFSGKFQRDGGIWSDMVEGYPKIDRNDSSLIVVRFPRFNIRLLYDPTLSVMVSGASSYSFSAIFVTMATAFTYTLLR